MVQPLPALLFSFALPFVGSCTTQRVTAETASESLLCVVRHAEAYKNLDPRPTGLTPEQLDSLTPTGETQADAARSTLPSGLFAVWTSPTGRTVQTAERLTDAAPIVDARLRSLDGDVAWDTRTAAWSGGHDTRPDDGESLADGARRVHTLVAEIAAATAPGEHAVVVTHGDIASILLGASRDTPLLERPALDTLATGEVACVPLATVSAAP